MACLVVDDYPPARQSMIDLLSAMGCASVSAWPTERTLALLAAGDGSAQEHDLLVHRLVAARHERWRTDRHLLAAGHALPGVIVVVSAGDPDALLRQEKHSTRRGRCRAEAPVPRRAARKLCRGRQVPATSRRRATPRRSLARAVLEGMRSCWSRTTTSTNRLPVSCSSGWGAQVDVAVNGRQAIEQLAAEGQNHYAVVLMDIEMPVMDGHEATRRLRADGRYADLPIIAMTAHVVGHGMPGEVEPWLYGVHCQTLRAGRSARPCCSVTAEPAGPVRPAGPGWQTDGR